MGKNYVDDHRIYLIQTRGTTDITEIISAPELRDELTAISTEVSFGLLRNSNNDIYMPWCNAAPGDKLRIVNHGNEIFAGTIISVGLDGNVTANDLGWYLSKSELIYQCSNAAASDAVRRLCAKAGIAAGVIDLPPTLITQVWAPATPETIISDILAICAAETGKTYKHRIDGGRLNIWPLASTPIVAYHKPAYNSPAYDITWAKGAISGSDSMEDLINAVTLTSSDNDTTTVLGRAYNAASIAHYGYIQKIESLSGDETTAQARQRIRNLLAESDRIKQERQIDNIWGADEVKSGVMLDFGPGNYGVSGLQRVTAVTHHYGANHMMSLTLQAAAQPRAAGSNDTITT